MQTAFATPALLFIGAMLLVPIVFAIGLSLTDAQGAIGNLSFVGVENYIRMLADTERFWPAAGRTLLFTIVAVGLELVLGMAIALLLEKPFRGHGFVRVLILLPIVATPVAVGMMWLMIFEPTIGFANQLLGLFGIPPQGWITDPKQALATLTFVDVWQWTPMVVLILLAGLTTVPAEPLEAAKIDGANGWQRFRHVVLPIIWPTVLVAILLRTIDGLKTFDILYAAKGAGGGAFHEVETLNIYGYGLSFQYSEYGYSSAVLMGFFLLVVGACLFLTIARNHSSNDESPKKRRNPSSLKPGAMPRQEVTR
jgi:multiple sugar transport system permease protein